MRPRVLLSVRQRLQRVGLCCKRIVLKGRKRDGAVTAAASRLREPSSADLGADRDASRGRARRRTVSLARRRLRPLQGPRPPVGRAALHLSCAFPAWPLQLASFVADGPGRCGTNRPIFAPANEPDETFQPGPHNGGNRSRVVNELALRPGFSAQARMPPTAPPAPRGERRGLLVLTAGSVPYFYRRYPTGPVVSSLPD